MPRVSSQFVNDCHKEIMSLRAEVAALKAELAQQTTNKQSTPCQYHCNSDGESYCSLTGNKV